MSGPGLRRLNFGTLPSREYLNMLCRPGFEGLPLGFKTADDVLREMRRLLNAGDAKALKVLLERVGFEWREPEARA